MKASPPMPSGLIPRKRGVRALWLLWGVSTAAAAAAPSSPTLPQIHVDAVIDAPENARSPGHVNGTMRIRNWAPGGPLCLYLPYADPDYGDDRGTTRRFEALTAKSARAVFSGGQMQVNAAAPTSIEPTATPQLVKVVVADDWKAGDELALTFSSTVPRLPKSRDDHWFYDGFMPQLLPHCPAAGLDPEYYRTSLSAHLTGQVRIPKGWAYAGPGHLSPDNVVGIDLTARTLAFGLEKDAAYQRKEFMVSGVPVTLLFHSNGFSELAATIHDVMPAMVDILGPYPFPSLTIVETSELQRHGLPGLIAMNQPAQALFSKVQRSLLNWQHWIFAIQLARQWYGGAIAPASPDDEWLIAGMVEFATLEALSRYRARFNLFNTDAGFRLLSFDYLQISEISAAVLRRSSPFSVLTDGEYTSRDPASVQHSLLFIKHAFALRQLKGFAGDPAFFRFTRSLTNHFLNQLVTPKDFKGFIDHLPSPFAPTMRQDLNTFLQRWWTLDGWPDFAMQGSEQTPLPSGQWLTTMRATQEGGVEYPPLFGVKDRSGRLYVARGEKKPTDPDGAWSASVVTSSEPQEPEVDPGHEAFDEDRFNNRLGPPGVTFFPGPADTLRDDTYTILWLPYAFRRPGEPFSLGLQAALLRYVSGGALLRVETAPGTNKSAVDLRDSFQIPNHALRGSVSLSQNYENDRLANLTVSRSPLFASNPAVSFDVSVRRRERAADPKSAHSTFAVASSLKPVGVRRFCSYRLNLQYEKAPGAFAPGFTYDREQATAAAECNITNRVGVSASLFRGQVAGDGDLPQVALFKPTELREAHLRLDQSGLDRARGIMSGSLDLFLPFYLPIPSDSLLLTRQMRWRLFYDLGHAIDLGLTYRSAGIGFLLPFGGDLTGAGSLALTRLSLLVVGYSQVGSIVSRKPAVLLDLTGEL